MLKQGSEKQPAQDRDFGPASDADADADMEQDTEQDQKEGISVEDEYKLWRSNVPMMYDFVSETKLVWPSLTLEWLPGSSASSVGRTGPEEGYIRQELLLGTHTSGEEENYLKIAAIDLPMALCDTKEDNDNDNNDEKKLLAPNSEFEPRKSNIKIIKKFPHDLEVTRARYMPQDPDIIATMNGAGRISLYNRSKPPSRQPIGRFSYHTDNGYGLSFNPNDTGKLLSGADDGKLALWDVMSSTRKPIQTWETVHKDIVNDCRWHNFNSQLFVSVSEDKTLCLHDLRLRSNGEIGVVASRIKVDSPFNSAAFSYHSEYLMCAAGTDSNVYLYDIRRMSSNNSSGNITSLDGSSSSSSSSLPLHTMQGHADAVTNVDFYSLEDAIVVSSGSDRRVIIWDLSQIGAEQTHEDAEDAVPELMMVHAGHRSPVNAFSLNIDERFKWLVASTEEDNVVQVWKCSSRLERIGGTVMPDLTDLI